MKNKILNPIRNILILLAIHIPLGLYVWVLPSSYSWIVVAAKDKALALEQQLNSVECSPGSYLRYERIKKEYDQACSAASAGGFWFGAVIIFLILMIVTIILTDKVKLPDCMNNWCTVPGLIFNLFAVIFRSESRYADILGDEDDFDYL